MAAVCEEFRPGCALSQRMGSGALRAHLQSHPRSQSAMAVAAEGSQASSLTRPTGILPVGQAGSPPAESGRMPDFRSKPDGDLAGEGVGEIGCVLVSEAVLQLELRVRSET